MYADRVTDSMRQAIGESRAAAREQGAYNEEHGITPTSIVKAIDDVLVERVRARLPDGRPLPVEPRQRFRTPPSAMRTSAKLEEEMKQAAANLDFEKAARLRDEIRRSGRRPRCWRRPRRWSPDAC